MIIPSDKIEDFGKVKTRFFTFSNGSINVPKLDEFLPHSVVVISKSDIKYINWCIQNGVVGWWSKKDMHLYHPRSHNAYAYTFYFHNPDHAVHFKLRYANDCEEMFL